MSFTAGTSLGSFVVRRLRPSAVVLLIACFTGGSLLIASLLMSVPRPLGLALLALGWGGGFGAMSGLAYLTNARISNSRLFAGSNGVATGLLVSGRALGAPLATPLVRAALESGGAVGAIRALGAGITLLLLPVAWVLRRLTWNALATAGQAQSASADEARGGGEGGEEGGGEGGGGEGGGGEGGGGEGVGGAAAPQAPVGRMTLPTLWVVLLCGSGPGLLCHGHAAALLTAASSGAAGATASLGPLGVSAMATGSLVGRLGGGVLLDSVPARRCLVIMPLITAASLAAPLALRGSVRLTAAALAGCGLSYGLLAVALPVLVSRLYGPERFPTTYGKVFTAWGTAGVAAPWLAGKLFDSTGGYNAALAVAMLASLASAAAASCLPSGDTSAAIGGGDGTSGK